MVNAPSFGDGNLVLKNVPIEWVDDSSDETGVAINNPFPSLLSVSDVKCIGYKSTGIVHFQFIAKNIDRSTSSARYYFGKASLYDDLGNSYTTSYYAYKDLVYDTPILIKYDKQSTQVTGVDTSADKFASISIIVNAPSFGDGNLILKNVPIDWQ